MQFKKYSSIQNSYRDKFVDECLCAITTGYCIDDFVVEEKAHGSNFSFYYNGEELKTASRNEFLKNDGKSFHQSHLVKDRYTNAIKALCSLLDCSENITIRVIGELIGGSYQHPNVEKVQNLRGVQKEVDYCPGHEFYAFDLFFLSEESPNGEVRYKTEVDKIKMNRLFEQAGLFYAKPLFRGTLKECLAFEHTFTSHIPGWLGLPEHPAANFAEGKVIKPVKMAKLGNGSRIILKDKTESFSEIETRLASKQKNDTVAELANILSCYITANRLSNVHSKLSEEYTAADYGRICGLLTQDALEEFNKDHAKAIASLTAKKQKLIRKGVRSKAITLVRATLPSEENLHGD
jgi:Rnl2 family RNA ligase